MLSDFVKYVKQYWHDRPDKSTPLNADRLNHIENGIASNSEAINQIANAVVSNIVNDPEKIASMAAVYALQEKLGTGELPSDAPNAISAINTLYSNLISSYEKLNDIVLMKCGNIVIIDIAILKATLPGGWTKLFDIPSGYLPLPDIKNVDMYYIGSMYVKNSDISKRIRVTNNVVYGYSDTSISGELYGMIVYVCG